ncbi:D-alanine--D-alanine ligase family protein [Desulfoluna spongiiphila]|uniref:D-alanine--D-alanine ligase n=1 Tax=Desulfoluna spongiiphila TaxID=419481 RepID=A0A1G5ADA2_9BACT|nr:D-alanine--D-alanine ligase [Desulfoluna spongiiphila]SCX75852.1 D-alanine--D-alanine ligase [Desulfoluna spongiiphila]VVS90689.1 d-alanine--d-alanine ligase [Desulfoluna spongiiphila]
MKKLNLAVIYGGTSPERDVSLVSGKEALAALDQNRYTLFEYDPKDGLDALVRDAEKLDAALILLHGSPGEDGTIQGLLDLLKIPYQGSGVLGSAIAMNKELSKKLYTDAGLPTPEAVQVRKGEPFDPAATVARLGLPLFVKPACGGSSLGMFRVSEEQELAGAVTQSLAYDETVVIEAFIDGPEVTCGVIGNEEPKALPVIEIIPEGDSPYFDYEAKYTPGATTEICPARISDALTARVMELAERAHRALHLKGYSRTDMMIKGDEIFLLETNTIPGMTRTSLLPRAAKVAGFSFSALLDRLIELALESNKERP